MTTQTPVSAKVERLLPYMRNLGMLTALLIALLVLGLRSPGYLTLSNFLVVAQQMAFIGIVALGMTHLVITGYLDLSIGSLFALCAVTAAFCAKSVPPIVALGLGIGVGGLVGWINGALVWRIKLSPIIITLGTLSILRGLVLLLTGGFQVRGVPKEFAELTQGNLLGVPMPVCVMLALAAVAYFVLKQTTLGRHSYAIGGNREACMTVGIPVRRLVLGSFALNGCIVGLSGALAASRFGSASPSFGVGMELDAITAVILGGVSLNGGEGNVPGVLLAVALIGVINSGIVALGIDPHYADIAKGIALLVAVGLDQLSLEARERYRKLLARRER